MKIGVIMGKLTESRESIEITSSFELQEYLVPGTKVNDESMKIWSDLIGQVNPGSFVMGWYTVDNGRSCIDDEVQFNEEMRAYIQEMTDPIYLKVDLKSAADTNNTKIPMKVQMLQLEGGKNSVKDLNYTILANEQEKIVSEYLNESIMLDKNESVGKHFCKSESDSLKKLKEKIDGLKNGLIRMKQTNKYNYRIINEINKLMNMIPVNESEDLKMKLEEINNESDLISLLHKELNNSINMYNVVKNCNECSKKLSDYEPKPEKIYDWSSGHGMGYGGGYDMYDDDDYDGRMGGGHGGGGRNCHHRGSGGGGGGGSGFMGNVGNMFNGFKKGFLNK